LVVELVVRRFSFDAGQTSEISGKDRIYTYLQILHKMYPLCITDYKYCSGTKFVGYI